MLVVVDDVRVAIDPSDGKEPFTSVVRVLDLIKSTDESYNSNLSGWNSLPTKPVSRRRMIEWKLCIHTKQARVLTTKRSIENSASP